MKIVFFGSSSFAVPSLKTLSEKYNVILVVTQPDKKTGRSLKPSATPVKTAANELGVRILESTNVNSEAVIEHLKKFDADIFVVVSFGQILKGMVLEIPRLYSINVHASLLPRYRGAAPINWAIANGEDRTGITIIRMNEGIDEGEIISKKEVSISKKDDAMSLSQRLSKEGALLLIQAIGLIEDDSITFCKQEGAWSYAPKLEKKDGLIDWGLNAECIHNRVRAFVPWPGCFTYWDNKILKIWKTDIVKDCDLSDETPGRVLDVGKNYILVSTGKDCIAIKELQLEGKRRMNAGEFIAGRKDMDRSVNFSIA